MLWVDEEGLQQAVQAFGMALHRCKDVQGQPTAPRPRATSLEEIRAGLLGLMATLLRIPVVPQGMVLTTSVPMFANGDADKVVVYTWPPKMEKRDVRHDPAPDAAERGGAERPTPPDGDGEPS